MTRSNVLLVVADSLRARSTSLLGYRRETTPFLDDFADEATVYKQARAPSNWTIPSHVSMFTGHEVPAHRFGMSDELDPGHTVFEELADAGYDTGLFTDNPFLVGHECNLEVGFETTESTPDAFAEKYATNGALGEWPNGFYYADRLLDWTDGREEWAACINLMDAHRPYEPLAEYDEWSDDSVRAIQEEMGFKWHWEFYNGDLPLGFADLLASIYDGGVRQVDAIAEQVVEGLAAQGQLDDTLVVVTGDHGEAFGDPSALDTEPPGVAHRIGTHESMYHVPLLVRAPGQRRGRRVDDLAHLTAFPDAVRTHALDEGRLDGAAFVADGGQAVAAQYPIDEGMREAAETFCGDADPFAKAAELVYEDRPGDAVGKRARWGEDAYETLVRGRAELTDRGRIDATEIEAVVDGAERVEVGTELDDYTRFSDQYETDVTEGVGDRLDALGYR